MKKKPVYVFYGYKGSGKDTCYEIAVNQMQDKKVAKYSFAGPMKDTLWGLYGSKIKDKERIWGSIDKKEEIIEDLPMHSSMKELYGYNETHWTGRRLLQWFGTEVGRMIYDGVWVDALANELINDKLCDIICITDCRFLNEYQKLKEMEEFDVHFVLVDRNVGSNEFSAHASEKDIKHFEYDVRIDNVGTLDDLQSKVIEIINT